MNAFAPSEYDLQAYADGQVDETLRRQVEIYLESHPEAAREVELLRQENERLRAAFDNVPATETPARLDPFRICRELRARSQRRMAIFMMVIFGYGISLDVEKLAFAVYDQDQTPWDDDIACARAAFAALNVEVRCAPVSWIAGSCQPPCRSRANARG